MIKIKKKAGWTKWKKKLTLLKSKTTIFNAFYFQITFKETQLKSI